MSKIDITLTSDEQTILRKAAYGAVTLLSMTRPGPLASTRQNMAGALALTGATGMVGQVLATKEKIVLKGTVAETAEQVLPALSQAVAVLDAKAPAETVEFQRVVTTALQQAADATHGPNAAQNDMIAKITAALQKH